MAYQALTVSYHNEQIEQIVRIVHRILPHYLLSLVSNLWHRIYPDCPPDITDINTVLGLGGSASPGSKCMEFNDVFVRTPRQ